MVDWVSPVVATGTFALKNHKEIGGLLSAVWSRLSKHLTELAITGTEGVGKSILLDNLTGKALETG